MTDLTPDALRQRLIAEPGFSEATVDGLRVLVKQATAADFVAFQRPLLDAAQRPEAQRDAASAKSYAALLRAVAYGVDKQPLLDGLTDAEIGQMPPTLYAGLLQACLEHSGIAAADFKAAKKN